MLLVLCLYHIHFLATKFPNIHQCTVEFHPSINCELNFQHNVTKCLNIINETHTSMQYEFLTLCKLQSYFSNDEWLAVLQPSFQSESPWSAAVQLHMDVLERHQLLYGLHHDFCAFSSVRPPCNHDATSSRQPETPGMRGTGGGVGWPVMGFPWTPSGGST